MVLRTGYNDFDTIFGGFIDFMIVLLSFINKSQHVPISIKKFQILSPNGLKYIIFVWSFTRNYFRFFIPYTTSGSVGVMCMC